MQARKRLSLCCFFPELTGLTRPARRRPNEASAVCSQPNQPNPTLGLHQRPETNLRDCLLSPYFDNLEITMSTSARRRLLRDFKRYVAFRGGRRNLVALVLRNVSWRMGRGCWRRHVVVVRFKNAFLS
jgi:hypothetical protein